MRSLEQTYAEINLNASERLSFIHKPLLAMIIEGSTWTGIYTLVDITRAKSVDRYDWSDNSSSAADRPSHFSPLAPVPAPSATSLSVSRCSTYLMHSYKLAFYCLTAFRYSTNALIF